MISTCESRREVKRSQEEEEYEKREDDEKMRTRKRLDGH
jgi:hypothetical protein